MVASHSIVIEDKNYYQTKGSVGLTTTALISMHEYISYIAFAMPK